MECHQGLVEHCTPSPSPSPHTHTPHHPPPTHKHTPHTLGGDFTVNLYTQRHPYISSTAKEFDPNLGRHDDFYLIGPYIFAQVWTSVWTVDAPTPFL